MKNVPLIPAHHWFFRNSLVVLKDPLAFFNNTFAEHGDIYDVNANFITVYVVANPDYIKEIVVSNKNDYAKSYNYDVLKYSLGNGLLTSEGEFWKKQRKIAQPAFHRESMKNLLDTMILSTKNLLTNWKGKEQISLTGEINYLTLDVVTKCLFGGTIEKTIYSEIQKAVGIGNRFLSKKIMTPFSPPVWFPTPSSIEYHKSRKFSSNVIFDVINKRREDKEEHLDLLSMLMHSKDEDTGETMSTQQLKDEVMTIFVAGHETTANALSWTFYLLSQNPDKLDILIKEIDTVLKGNEPTFQSLKELEYTGMVLEESMRLYPPAWSMGRRVVNETEMCGFKMKKNAEIIIDIYMLHRHPKYWEKPLEFQPERFLPEQKKERHKYCYIPFGAGQRMCIGNNFAMMEMKIILAMLLQKYDFKMAKNAPDVIPEPLVTLKPLSGILMDIQER